MEKELLRKGTGMKKKKIYMSLPLYKQGISVRTKETNATGCLWAGIWTGKDFDSYTFIYPVNSEAQLNYLSNYLFI